jgi:hypothetical protein
MSQQAIDIERVVREVLAELAAAPAAAVPSEKKASGGTEKVLPARPKAENAVEKRPAVDGDLVIASRVVTMNDIAGRLASVRRVVVARKAIVTPAVQDELIRRSVDLTYADSLGAPATIVPRLVMICTGVEFDPAALIAVLEREKIQVEQSSLDCLIATTEQLAAELAKPNTLGLLLTVHTAAGVCLANRLRGVRAVTGVDAPAVATAAAAVGANLLVANPRAGSFFQLKQMATEFCRGGVRPCPGVFRKQLG